MDVKDSPCSVCVVRSMCAVVCPKGTLYLIENEGCDAAMGQVLIRTLENTDYYNICDVKCNHRGIFKTFRMETHKGKVDSFKLTTTDPFPVKKDKYDI